MKIAYFDCFSGISGDMVLGALVDAGCSLEQIESLLRELRVTGWKISSEKVTRRGLAATRVIVQSSEPQAHRSLSEIIQWIEQAKLPPQLMERASHIFRRLAEAETRVQGMSHENLNFHGTRAIDVIVEIVGAVAGFRQLGIEEFSCSPLNVGGASVNARHGTLPVPVPATADLLRGAPTYSSGTERELVTPAGAAIVAALASRFGPQPAMTVVAIGMGAGSEDLAEHANIFRLFIGETASQHLDGLVNEDLILLEATIDDMSPQVYGYFAERTLEAGALDVFSTAVHMKQNRLGQSVTVLCEPAKRAQLTDLLFRETTTLVVRQSSVRRRSLQREHITVETSLGAIRVKVARGNGQILNVAPEYEDCKKLAAEHGVPLKQILAEAAFQFRKRRGS